MRAIASAGIREGVTAAILEHRLLPGTKLGEDEIGEIYGASRTLVRTALQQLAHEGIVNIEKNRGAFVARPTPADAREVFEARRLIEPTIVDHALMLSRRPGSVVFSSILPRSARRSCVAMRVLRSVSPATSIGSSPR